MGACLRGKESLVSNFCFIVCKKKHPYRPSYFTTLHEIIFRYLHYIFLGTCITAICLEEAGG